MKYVYNGVLENRQEDSHINYIYLTKESSTIPNSLISINKTILQLHLHCNSIYYQYTFY